MDCTVNVVYRSGLPHVKYYGLNGFAKSIISSKF